jgi:hypothetical protein
MSETPSFTCPTCSRVSYNENDIENRYCVACHCFFGRPGQPGEGEDAPREGFTEIDPKKFLINPADAQTYTGTFAFNEQPWFPCSITIGDCTIALLADGKWEGSIEGLRAALASSKSYGVDTFPRMVLWLVLRQMESDQRFW